jgi:hypothetical protein
MHYMTDWIIECFNKSLEIKSPNDANAWNGKGESLIGLGKGEDAKDYLLHWRHLAMQQESQYRK